jgi:ribonuclease P/MRP protein subunit RPP1
MGDEKGERPFHSRVPMACVDACVIPYPEGDSSIQRMALEARELGFDGIVCIGSAFRGRINGITVLSGMILHPSSMKDVINSIRKYTDTVDCILLNAGDAKFNRAALSYHGIHILRGVHTAYKHGLDHVSAKNAADSNIAIDIDLSVLIRARGISRQRALQCYRDLIGLQRRFEFPLTISTGARSILELRSKREIANICALFGMEEDEVSRALGTVDRLLAPGSPVEVLL